MSVEKIKSVAGIDQDDGFSVNILKAPPHGMNCGHCAGGMAGT